MDLLNDFTEQVVVSRRETGFRKWTSCLGEDLGSRPSSWLRPDFAPPSPFFVIKDPQTQSSRILVKPHLTDAEFRKAWMPFFCRSGHPVVTTDQFLAFVDHLCLRNFLSIFLGLRVGTCRRLLGLKRLLQAVWMGGRGMRLALPLPGFSGLAALLELVETSGVWPQSLLDAFFAMVPKADGDSTSLDQRPLSVLPVLYRLWASLGSGLRGGYLNRCLVFVIVYLRLRPGFQQRWI